MNEPEEVLAAFKTYYTTATLSGITDPNIVLDLGSKIDSMGFYDEFEVNRVVYVELNPDAKQAQLEAAITPVADRLLKQFKTAQTEFKAATANKDAKAASAAKDQMDALILFRADMGTFHRLYAFLSQIFEKVNDLFKGELTDNDKLVYVNNVILGKLLESKVLIQQALNNSKEQFANSPDLDESLMNAIMEALDAHNLMSSQALSSEAIRRGLKAILLGPAKLYETLRTSVCSEPESNRYSHD